MNRDVKQRLAQAFGLSADNEVDTLLASLQDDGDIDPQVLWDTATIDLPKIVRQPRTR